MKSVAILLLLAALLPHLAWAADFVEGTAFGAMSIRACYSRYWAIRHGRHA